MSNELEAINKTQSNCIEGILHLMKFHEMDAVRIFPHRSLSIKTLGAAFALADFLKSIDINCEVVVEHYEDVKKGLPEVEHKISTKNFLAVAVDCRKQGDIENLLYQETYILLTVFGPCATKSFGVLDFVKKDVCGAAEIIYQDIMEYCKDNNMDMPLSTAQFLYLSIIGGTKRFGNNIRSNTFNVVQHLLSLGVDYRLANELSDYKNEKILKCQSLILKNLKKHDKVMTVLIPVEELTDDLRLTDFKDALDTFRCVKEVLVWVCLIENSDHYFHVFLQGKETNSFPVSRIAIKNNGTGEHADAECIIPISDFNKILHDTLILIPDQLDEIKMSYGESNALNLNDIGTDVENMEEYANEEIE